MHPVSSSVLPTATALRFIFFIEESFVQSMLLGLKPQSNGTRFVRSLDCMKEERCFINKLKSLQYRKCDKLK